MRALVYEEYVFDDNYKRIIRIKEIPQPQPKPNEVVFEVKAAGPNYDDICGMKGKPIQIPMPPISGTDAAYQIVAVGENVTISICQSSLIHAPIMAACTFAELRNSLSILGSVTVSNFTFVKYRY